MFDRTKRCLLSVWMVLIELFAYRFANDTRLTVQRPIFLFVDGFKFGLEQPKNRLQKTLRFYDRPLFEPIGWKVNPINRLFDARVCVQRVLAHSLV